MKTKTLIKNSLEYLDEIRLNFTEISVKKDKLPKFNKVYDFEKNYITYYDDNNNKFKSEIQILGSINNNTWVWSWSQLYNKNSIFVCKQLLKYGLDMDIFDEKSNLIKQLLINSHLKISDEKSDIDRTLEIFLAIISYLCKGKYIYITRNNNILYYYIFINIKKIN